MNRVKIFLFLLIISLNLYGQNDCKDAIFVCGNSGFQGISATGAGQIAEYSPSEGSCFSAENNSLWLKLYIKTSGTLGFILRPENTSLDVDFDFLVFGPTATCNSLGQSIRCSSTNPALAKLQNNTTGMTGQDYDTSEGPGEKGNGFVSWLTVTAGQSYYIVIDRFSGNTNFSIQWTGTATFDDPPRINVQPYSDVLDLEKVDYSGETNPSVSFDLTKNTSIIVDNQTDMAVTYHTTSNDAILNLNAIQNPADFKNTTSPQTLYPRITNTKTGCYNWISFNIKVSDKLNFPKTTINICDDQDSNSTDGKAQINLDDITASIFENQNLQNLTLKYYLSRNDAETETNPLSGTFSNSIPFQQSIFIKASNKTASVAIQEIKVFINPLPEIKSAILVQCDTDQNSNGLVLFNLKEANSVLTNNNPDLETLFFLSNNDALNNLNALNTEFKNTSNPQQLFARVTNAKTNCFSISNLTLKTNIIPESTFDIDPVCDDDGIEDGFHLLDLTKSNIPITGSQNIAYFSTENDALLEQNSILNPTAYQNEIPYDQFIFARIEEGNDCYGISKIKLHINKLPNIETSAVTNICENLPFYKAHLDAGIIELSTINNFIYSWFKDGVKVPDATSYSLDVNESGTYTANITNSNNCTKTRTIEVSGSNTANIESIDVVDLIDGSSNKITIIVSGKGNYEYSLNAPYGPFQDSNTFDNLSAGIYEVYVNDKKNCGVVHKTAAVVGAPKFFTPNDDGYNDYWNIVGLNTTENRNATIYIFDRYGKLIKQIHPFDLGWDGTFANNPLPSDDYWYTLKLADNREAKGHFSLKR
ncbi:hypothetical protein BSF41_37710 [Flavobacterium sp. ACN2]|uniref:T9SS type B sorting domain-containing protein n=1 Tax=Flavobacterium sp. ACN2 TaxID=1975676 RepID=UPI000BB3559E|nr:T9SS type B sorting domain-containing protein [Flavobacterium sp. ACN2]PBI85303.1 hypothetical protein BSF41_37710 [Flavobacterium sp. ACN2]